MPFVGIVLVLVLEATVLETSLVNNTATPTYDTKNWSLIDRMYMKNIANIPAVTHFATHALIWRYTGA